MSDVCQGVLPYQREDYPVGRGRGKSKVDRGPGGIKLLGSSLGRSNQRCGRIGLPANRTEPETYNIDDTIRVPVALRDEEGVAHVRAIFRRVRRPGNLGPRGLDPDDTLELRGNGRGQKQATVETTLKVGTNTSQATTSVWASRPTTPRATW